MSARPVVELVLVAWVEDDWSGGFRGIVYDSRIDDAKAPRMPILSGAISGGPLPPRLWPTVPLHINYLFIASSASDAESKY